MSDILGHVNPTSVSNMSNACTWQPSDATLIDGTVVSSCSEEWRFECEATHILGLPNKPRRIAMLEAIEKRRGLDARKALEVKILEVWSKRQELAAAEAAGA